MLTNTVAPKRIWTQNVIGFELQYQTRQHLQSGYIFSELTKVNFQSHFYNDS